jgi:hypothetical protein
MTEKSPPYTGRRADYIIVDDPHADATPEERHKIARWFAWNQEFVEHQRRVEGWKQQAAGATHLDIYITDDGRMLYLPADIDDGDQDTRL